MNASGQGKEYEEVAVDLEEDVYTKEKEEVVVLEEKEEEKDDDARNLDVSILRKKLQNARLDVLRLTVTDVHGQQRICRHYVTDFEEIARKGSEVFCGTILHGMRSEDITLECIERNSCGNVAVVPQLETFSTMPWISGINVGELLCETKELPRWTVLQASDDPTPGLGESRNSVNTTTTTTPTWSSRGGFSGLAAQKECTRYIARKLLRQLSQEFGLTLRSAFEIEFVDLRDEYGRCCAQATASAHGEAKLTRLCRDFIDAGIGVQSFSREFAPGQYELNQTPTSGVQSADQAVRVKQAVKETYDRGAVTFMPKSRHDQCCNGMHFNFSLITANHAAKAASDGGGVGEGSEGIDKSAEKVDANAFTSRTGTGAFDQELSATGEAWLQGLLDHVASLTALCNPTVNCYRRLHNPWTPHLANWAYDDRHAAFRVRRGGQGVFVESRLPSGAANPYLVIAGHLIAGIQGLRKYGRSRNNDTGVTPTSRRGGSDVKPTPPANPRTTIPDTLQTALGCLSGDPVMVGGLGEEFVRAFVDIKKQGELNVLNSVDVSEKPKSDDDLREEKDVYLINA